MTHEEFERWLVHHQGAYPGLGNWIKANPEQLVHWERLLACVSFAEAKCATNRLVALDDQPKGYSDHPRVIRRLATDSRSIQDRHGPRRGPQVQDDHLVASCPRCMDHGLVSVLTAATLRRLSQGDQSHGLLTCSVACDCEAGELYAKRLPRWRPGFIYVKYEDILDCAGESRIDLWDAAREAMQYAREHAGPRDTELTADNLP